MGNLWEVKQPPPTACCPRGALKDRLTPPQAAKNLVSVGLHNTSGSDRQHTMSHDQTDGTGSGGVRTDKQCSPLAVRGSTMLGKQLQTNTMLGKNEAHHINVLCLLTTERNYTAGMFVV